MTTTLKPRSISIFLGFPIIILCMILSAGLVSSVQAQSSVQSQSNAQYLSSPEELARLAIEAAKGIYSDTKTRNKSSGAPEPVQAQDQAQAEEIQHTKKEASIPATQKIEEKPLIKSDECFVTETGEKICLEYPVDPATGEPIEKWTAPEERTTEGSPEQSRRKDNGRPVPSGTMMRDEGTSVPPAAGLGREDKGQPQGTSRNLPERPGTSNENSAQTR